MTKREMADRISLVEHPEDEPADSRRMKHRADELAKWRKPSLEAVLELAERVLESR